MKSPTDALEQLKHEMCSMMMQQCHCRTELPTELYWGHAEYT